jgi:hypothetical protein
MTQSLQLGIQTLGTSDLGIGHQCFSYYFEPRAEPCCAFLYRQTQNGTSHGLKWKRVKRTSLLRHPKSIVTTGTDLRLPNKRTTTRWSVFSLQVSIFIKLFFFVLDAMMNKLEC